MVQVYKKKNNDQTRRYIIGFNIYFDTSNIQTKNIGKLQTDKTSAENVGW